ncbi:MAG: hypothetical protein KatS3mg060_0779 [Dehalococcoidia bacterium]|nr:MAG: hypothetical protein KatS3mg060_0779 [Dehalococcoidia bacterium]
MDHGGAHIPDWLSVDLLAESPLVFFRGRPGVITAVSPNVERLLGYPTREIVGRPNFWIDHLHPDDAPALLEAARAATRQRQPSNNLIYRFRHRNGSYRWVNWITHRRYDEAGTITELFGYVLDVTERHEASLARERLLVSEGQLQGVLATARQVADSLNNAFAIATSALELAQLQGADPAIIQPAIEALLGASKQIALLRRVVRVSLTETPVGPALDLAASISPETPAER